MATDVVAAGAGLDAHWYQTFFDEHWLTISSQTHPPEKSAAEVEFLVEELGLQSGQTVLDLPCGHGRHSIESGTTPATIQRIELNPFSLEVTLWGLIIGEPDGASSSRLAIVHALLATAGFNVTSSPAIRREAWYKLWGNLTMNPVSALTGATGDRMLDDPLVRNFCSAAMLEAQAIGTHIGCAIDQTAEERHAVTRELGAFKTSMLVDAERGRPIELDALVTAVHELGRRTGAATPNIDALLGLTRLFARSRGLYP